jgi:hypothetical protein
VTAGVLAEVAARRDPAPRTAPSLRPGRSALPVPGPLARADREAAALPPAGRVARQSTGSGQPVPQAQPAPLPVGGSSFAITQDPVTGLELKSLLGKWRARPVTPTAIKMVGRANLACHRGASGHELGVHQVMTKEVNNARYRGATSADGSVWFRRDTPAVHPAGPCSDSPYQKFWNAVSPGTCGTTVSVEFSDWPQDMYNTIVTNPTTNRPNYLTALKLEFEFTTALMHRKPDGSLDTLRWLRWGVGWDYQFATPPSGESRITRGLATGSSITFTGTPAAPPELPTRYAIPAKNCNTLTMEASDNPAALEASDSW